MYCSQVWRLGSLKFKVPEAGMSGECSVLGSINSTVPAWSEQKGANETLGASLIRTLIPPARVGTSGLLKAYLLKL